MPDLTRLIDVSLPITGDMLLYPGDHAPVLRQLASLKHGDRLTLTELTIGCHVGTHVDAPAHFIHDGPTVDQLDREHFAGPATVLDLTGRTVITRGDLEQRSLPGSRHLFLKTDNSLLLKSNRFVNDYCHLTFRAPDLGTGSVRA
jgi:arylformamidase